MPRLYVFILAGLSSLPSLNFQSAPLQSTLIVIGGRSNADNASNFISKWAPLFEDYLTNSIGPQIQPPVAFKLIPIGYSPETGALEMFLAGKVDLVCKYPAPFRSVREIAVGSCLYRPLNISMHID